MILFARDWHGSSWADTDRAVASLGLFVGHLPQTERSGNDLFAELRAPRARPQPGWRVARSRHGWPALLCGWIDNHAELAGELDLPADCPARLMAQAVERWGEHADRRIVGCYAAIVCLPDGRVRLSRSPWGGQSLFYHDDGDALLAASIPRPLFAAGLDKRLRDDAIDRLLAMELPHDEQAMFANVSLVPHGSVVTLSPGKAAIDRWYDPLAIAPQKLKRDADYVEAANALLAEAVARALPTARKPGILLSGGLDSPLVGAEMLRQLPPGQRLPSFTFHPLPEWDGQVLPHKFGDDRPFVEQFAQAYPALDPHFIANRGVEFDDRAAQLFTACDAGYPARVLASAYNGLFATAASEGCDWVFTAECGNLTFSNAAPWAPGELLFQGHWRQLWQLMDARLGDPRPVVRRIAAHALMPRLPSAAQAAIRKALHGNPDGAARFANPFLRAGRRPASGPGNIMTADREESRAAYIRANYHAMGLGGEIQHGYEQVFGLQLRDVTAYRPLIEFCLAVPTDQLVRDGESRWLARRMAQGRLPEAQRRNRLYGEHNADWHARLTPRLGELHQRVAALAQHPQLGGLLDVAAMGAALRDWPETTPTCAIEAERLRFYLPSMLYVAQYIDHVTGRNSP